MTDFQEPEWMLQAKENKLEAEIAAKQAWWATRAAINKAKKAALQATRATRKAQDKVEADVGLVSPKTPKDA